MKPTHVAIIGAGPSGLLLALALTYRQVHSTVYEARSPGHPPSGGVVLSPNALRLLEPLGVYSRILPLGFEFENSDVVSEEGQTLDRHYYGHQRLYGYKALRIARHTLLDVITSLLERRSQHVQVRYNSRYSGIVSDSGTDVSFIINGRTEMADMLIGADGIHSLVRAVIDPVELRYGGIAGITTIVPREEIRYSRPDHPAAAVIRGQNGAMLIVPEDREGRTSMAAIQLPHPELDRKGWDALQADKGKLKELLLRNFNAWGDMNRSIIESMCRHDGTMLLWPFYQVPSLSSWASQTRRILLVGDSAHAIPPSSGQGISQAVEDVYSLAYLFDAIREGGGITLASAVDFWQSWRQKRIKEIEDVVNAINIKRLPETERGKHTDILEDDLENVETGEGQYSWLFNTHIDDEMNAWIVTKSAS